MSKLIPAVALGMAACVLAACRSPAYPAAAPRPVHAALSPSAGPWIGAYETDPGMGYGPYRVFAEATGQKPRILVNYSSWFERFRTRFAEAASAHRAVACFQIQPAGVSLRDITAGRYDTWLRSYAAAVRRLSHPVIIGFAHEMNGSWYPWGYRHTPAAVWVAAWRHIVDIFRAEGAANVTWLWTINRTTPGVTGPPRDWWPGSGYVTWVGINGYYLRPRDTFASLFAPAIRQVRAITGKPILLSETGIGPAAGQARKIPDLFAGLRRYGLLGLIWFDVRQHAGLLHQDWRLEDDPAALAAFRAAAKQYR